MIVRVEHAAWMIGEASPRFTRMPPFTYPSIQKIDSRKETVVHLYNENAPWRRKIVLWQLKTSLGLKVGYQGKGEELLLAKGRERARQLSRRKNEGRIWSNCYRHHAKAPRARKITKLWHVTATEINSVWLNSWIFLFCSRGKRKTIGYKLRMLAQDYREEILSADWGQLPKQFIHNYEHYLLWFNHHSLRACQIHSFFTQLFAHLTFVCILVFVFGTPSISPSKHQRLYSLFFPVFHHSCPSIHLFPGSINVFTAAEANISKISAFPLMP